MSGRGALLMSTAVVIASASIREIAYAVVAGPSADPAATSKTASCREHLEEGGKRPKVSETLPEKGTSGYALFLDVTVEHEKGESVLPSGFSLQADSAEARALAAAGFHLPHPEATLLPSLEADENGTRTRLKIPFVPLPEKPGRQDLVLPPVPIALARVGGAVVTVCTTEHTVAIEDPTANDPEARPKGNPKPERQLEEWTTLKHAIVGAAIALLTAVLAALAVTRFLKRPRKAKPPIPPRPPWEVALEELFDLRNAQLISQGRHSVHFDRASHIVRKYLGGRYGFDGLESTTQEMLDALRRSPPPDGVRIQIEAFLEKADLVKFAKLSPTEAECEMALERAEEIVRKTVPTPVHRVNATEPAPIGGGG